MRKMRAARPDDHRLVVGDANVKIMQGKLEQMVEGDKLEGTKKQPNEEEWSKTVGETSYVIKDSYRKGTHYYILWEQKQGEGKKQRLEIVTTVIGREPVLKYMTKQANRYAIEEITLATMKMQKTEWMKAQLSQGGEEAPWLAKKRPSSSSAPKKKAPVMKKARPAAASEPAPDAALDVD